MQTERIDQARVGIEAVSSRWVLISLSLIAIAPFWTVRYPVMIDYPNHLARWFVLFHMNDPGYHFQDLYAPAWGLLPYISVDVLAIGLQHFLPIAVVGKCILSLCVILTAALTHFFVKQACSENLGLSSFGILIALNPMFLMGSISFGFSIAFCMLVVGLWVRYCREPRVITALCIVGGLMLVYLTHLYGFVVAGFAMGIYSLFQDQRWKKLAILAVLSVPELLILLHNPIHTSGGPSVVYAGLTPKVKLASLFFPVRLYTSKITDYVLLAGLALLVYLILKDRLTLRLRPAWLAVCAILLLIYFVAPADYGDIGAYMDERLLPFLYLFCLAVAQFKRIPWYLSIGLVVLILFRVAAIEQMFISQQSYLQQLTDSFQEIPRNAKVLPIVRLPRTGYMGRGDIHHMEYGIIERGFLDPVLFHVRGVQPIRLVGSPYCPTVHCEVAEAADVDWQQIANSYDYLWVHGDPEITTSASRIGDVIFLSDAVTIYRVRHPQP